MKNKYLFIIGLNKAGTTSIYKYLEVHPEISTQVTKQNFYFLGKNWYKNHKDFVGPIHEFNENYLGFIDKFDNTKKIFIDSSPEYFFCSTALERIKKFSKNNDVHLIVVFRDPIERMISLYKYSLQIGTISSKMDFKTYIKKSIEETNLYDIRFNGLITSDYNRFYSAYKNNFGKRIHPFFFEDFVVDPESVVNKIFNFLDLKKIPLDHINKVHNKSKSRARSRLLTLLYTKIRYYFLRIFSSVNLNEKSINFISNLGRYINNKILLTKSNFTPQKCDLDLLRKNIKIDYNNFKNNIKS